MSHLTAELRDQSLEKANWADLEFVRKLLDDASINAVALEPWSGGGGLSGDSNVLTITRGGGDGNGEAPKDTKYFLKLTMPEKIVMSKAAGLAREGIFLDAMRNNKKLNHCFPEVLYAHGDMTKGRKVVAMECVDGVQAGYFYGPYSIHNIGRDLSALTEGYGAVDEKAVTLACFAAAADLHGPYWKDSGNEHTNLSSLPHLRCADWLAGEGKDTFLASMDQAHRGWKEAKRSAEAGGLKLTDNLVEVMDAALAKTNWDTYRESLKTQPTTLIHSDFHPSNIVIRRPQEPFKTRPVPAQLPVLMVDWEVVAVGVGPQDLGQFQISHSSPENRRATTDEGLQLYHDRLKSHGVNVSMDFIREQYVASGLGRWIWLLAIIAGLGLNVSATQYFCDQVAAFIEDHGVNAANAPIVRA